MFKRALAMLFLAALALPASAQKTLDIYFIDVEGGQSTLIVSPRGESLLIDSGWAGNGKRDANRVMAAAKAAGIAQIDYLLATHLHADHIGGVPELAAAMPVKAFIDYGDIVPDQPARVVDPFKAYAATRARARHVVAKPGDAIPLQGVEVRIVSSAGNTIAAAVDGSAQANAFCEPQERAPNEALENPRSNGIHLRYGKFRFVDLGDLSGKPLYSLFCPNNLLGGVELFLVPHHGGSDNAAAAPFAMKPRVAIMNNGETKGGSPQVFATLHDAMSRHELADVWQIDKSANEGVRNFADARIANLDGSTGHWIKVSASESGTFTVTNGRTGETRSYQPR